jgi:hypothetical protein
MQTDQFQPRLLRWFVILVCLACVSAVTAPALIPPGEPAALLAAFLCLVWLGSLHCGSKPGYRSLLRREPPSEGVA